MRAPYVDTRPRHSYWQMMHDRRPARTGGLSFHATLCCLAGVVAAIFLVVAALAQGRIEPRVAYLSAPAWIFDGHVAKALQPTPVLARADAVRKQARPPSSESSSANDAPKASGLVPSGLQDETVATPSGSRRAFLAERSHHPRDPPAAVALA